MKCECEICKNFKNKQLLWQCPRCMRTMVSKTKNGTVKCISCDTVKKIHQVIK